MKIKNNCSLTVPIALSINWFLQATQAVKFQFVELDFSNLTFQKSSMYRWIGRIIIYSVDNHHLCMSPFLRSTTILFSLVYTKVVSFWGTLFWKYAVNSISFASPSCLKLVKTLTHFLSLRASDFPEFKHKEAFSTLVESLVQMTCSHFTNFLNELASVRTPFFNVYRNWLGY